VAGGEGVAGMAAKLEVVIQQVHPLSYFPHLQVSTGSCSTCLSFLLSSMLKQRRYCNLYVQKVYLELYSTV
jgi:hypothetical protein